MKQILIIFTMLLFGCSTPQEQNDNSKSSDTLQQVTGKLSRYMLKATNNCNQMQLSKQFDLSLSFKRYADTMGNQDSCFLMVYLKDKSTKSTMDSISMTSLYYHSDVFMSCDNMTSYTTNFKTDREFSDNYFGDIVVVDFNFDGKDDVAMINDSGGNAGPLYSFYIQTNDREFILDTFLTDRVIVFPTEINTNKKTLTTYIHANVSQVSEYIYRFDIVKNSWTEQSLRMINSGDK